LELDKLYINSIKINCVIYINMIRRFFSHKHSPTFKELCIINKKQNNMSLKLLNSKQYYYYNSLKLSYKKIILVNGPINSGKTLIGTCYGYEMLLSNLINKFVIVHSNPQSYWKNHYHDIFINHFQENKFSEIMYNDKLVLLTCDKRNYNKYDNSFILADNMEISNKEHLINLLEMVGNNTRLLLIENMKNDFTDNIFLNQHSGFNILNKINSRKNINEDMELYENKIMNIEFNDNDVVQDNIIINDILNKL
jgi:thymidine kinase